MQMLWHNGKYERCEFPGYMYRKFETAKKELPLNFYKAWIYDISKLDWTKHDFKTPKIVEVELKEEFANV